MHLNSIAAELSSIWAPPPILTVSQWADENRQLSLESAARAGQWKTRPYQKEPMDAFTNPAVHTIVLMVARQTLKTEIVNNCIGYAIDQDPGPMMVVQFREKDCVKWSKIRLAPMLRDTPCLRGKVSEERSRSEENTLEYKAFPGGHLSVVASASPGNLMALPIRYLFCDEIDKYPETAGSGGDPISLAQGRQEEFWNRKTVLACTPTEYGRSRIGQFYDLSDQRDYEIPCPSCGTFQIPTWGQVRWDSKLPRDKQAASAKYHCAHCDFAIDDVLRSRAIERGRYRAQAAFNGIAGFRVSGICRLGTKLSSMVEEFLSKKDNVQALKTFVNEQLAELWREKGEAPDSKRLHERAEPYDVGIVPPGGLLLTAAVDVQGDWLAFEVKAWGRNGESWSVYYEEIRCQRMGSDGNMVTCRTSEPEPWKRLAELIGREWECASGGKIPIMACGIDTGFNPDVIYSFCRHYPQPAHGPAGSRIVSYRTVVPIKGGHSSFKIIEGVSDTDAARKRDGLKIITIGSPCATQQIYDALRLEAPVDSEPYPRGYIHLPKAYEFSYFQGITAETRIIKNSGAIEWRRDGRNEPLDLAKYHLGMAALCDIEHYSEVVWKELERRMQASAAPAQLPDGEPKPKTPAETSSNFFSKEQQAGTSEEPKPSLRPVRFRQ